MAAEIAKHSNLLLVIGRNGHSFSLRIKDVSDLSKTPLLHSGATSSVVPLPPRGYLRHVLPKNLHALSDKLRQRNTRRWDLNALR